MSNNRIGKFFTVIAKSTLALLSLLVAAVLVSTAYLTWHYTYGLGLPDANRLAAVAATGRACSGDSKHPYVPLAEIPPLLRKAVILYEDPDFYERPSLNPFAEFMLAIAHNRRPRGSGITGSVAHCLMSLAGSCCRGPGLGNAFAHLVLQGRVARVLSRDRIFEVYLNESYFGRGSFGVGAASMSYYGEPLELLSIDQIALIAVLPRSPWLQHDRAVERRNTVIEKLLQAGVVNDAEASSARERPLGFRDVPSRIQPL